MRNAYRESLVWAVALATLMLPLPSAAVPLASSQAYEQAQFVFAGTVVRTGSNVASLGADVPAIVVRVDKVYKGTPVFADLVHRQVTVMTPAGAAPPKPGTSAIFSTAGYAFAENAVVREIAMEPGTATDATARRAAAFDAAGVTNRLRTNLAASDVVVVGTVVGDIRRVAVKRTFGEHDPQLRVADVAVKSVERGKAANTVTVLFSASGDERWLRSPKLRTGEQAVFSLQRDRQIGAAAGVPDDIAARAYTAYEQHDVRPLSALPAVRSVLQQFRLK